MREFAFFKILSTCISHERLLVNHTPSSLKLYRDSLHHITGYKNVIFY
jgi:hypothetical protein